jgi:hypothetical protein
MYSEYPFQERVAKYFPTAICVSFPLTNKMMYSISILVPSTSTVSASRQHRKIYIVNYNEWKMLVNMFKISMMIIFVFIFMMIIFIFFIMIKFVF